MNETAALRLVLALSLGTASCVMLGLPLIYLRLPNPRPTEVPDLKAAGRGVYLRSAEETWRLFPHAAALEAAPADAPRVSAVEAIIVAARQPGALEGYRIRRLPDREQLPALESTASSGDSVLVRLEPAELATGIYEVTVPRESIYGGTDFVYFTVSR